MTYTITVTYKKTEKRVYEVTGIDKDHACLVFARMDDYERDHCLVDHDEEEDEETEVSEWYYQPRKGRG